nr:hypothetical protein [Tanacetum cinerariifolium]
MNDSMIELRDMFQAWLQQQVVNLDSYTPEPSQCRKIPIYYDDDDDEESSTPLIDIIISELPSRIAITPVLSTEEPKDSLIIGDEHLDTIPKKESDEFIKSSVKNLVPTQVKIDETDFDPEEEIRFVMRLLYDNSSPRPPKEFNSKNSDAIIESFSPSHIPVEDSDSLIEEIDLFLSPNESIPLCIENDDYDSKGGIFFLKELLSNDFPSLPENESFYFDVPSSPHPPVKPPDDDGIFFDDKLDCWE